jgi:hypothetical protein
MVCELSADPPTDFQCNTTTTTLNDQDEEPPLSMLTMSNTADMVGSLRPATTVSTNSMKQDYSSMIVVFLSTTIVVGVVLVRWRKGNANRGNFTSIGDTNDDVKDRDDAAALHPTLYNSI